MKAKLLGMVMVISSLIFATSCQKDNAISVDSTVKASFGSMFPNATAVKWSKDDSYLLSTFEDDGKGKRAWFDRTGAWYLTETDILYTALPQEIKTAFEEGVYKDWYMDDIDVIERPGVDIVYVLEVKNGLGEEYDLHYSTTGVLLKEVKDIGNSGQKPSVPGQTGSGYIQGRLSPTIIDFLTSRYSGFTVLEIDKERTKTEVDIRHNNVHKEVVFNSSDQWVHTEIDIRVSDLPVALRNVINSSYSNYRIDDVDFYETPTGNYYKVELEGRNDREITIRISESGTIL